MCALQYGKALSFSSIGSLLLDRLNSYAAVIHPFLPPFIGNELIHNLYKTCWLLVLRQVVQCTTKCAVALAW